MKTRTKKAVVFAFIISFATSVYAAFLNTLMKQGFFTEHFLDNWFGLVPRTYLLILPFILITGPAVRALVGKLFSNKEKNH